MRVRISWLLPPPYALAGLAVLVLLMELLGALRPPIFFYFFFVLQGGWRASWFHPISNARYREWLERTPWKAPQPLPLGPVHLVPADAVIVGALCLLAFFYPGADPLVGIQVFAFSYLGVMALGFWHTGLPVAAQAVAFGLGAMLLRLPVPYIGLAVAAVLYGICLWALRKSLTSFPWKGHLEGLAIREVIRLQKQPPGADDPLKQSWPFEWLPPLHRGPWVGHRDAALLSLLAGWWLHLLGPLFEANALRVVAPMIVLAAAVKRTVLYARGHGSPVNVVGRIHLMRPILPGYDRIFAAPLLGVAAMVAITWLLDRLRLPPRLVHPVALTIGLWTILALGPRLKEWRLTGQHRLAPPSFGTDKSNVVEVA